MKKLLFALFAAVFAVSIIGCSNSSGGDSPDEGPFVANKTPLTLEAVAAGTITLENPWSTLKYKKNGGDFVSVTASANTISVAAGDKVAFYADGSENTYNSSTLYVTGFTISCSSDCYVYGNVMSLLSSSDFKNATSINREYAFALLFFKNTHIKKHEQKELVLPATSLSNSCYYCMFCGCTGLTSAPALPATTLAYNCYNSMFGLAGLTSAPILPATTLADSCYIWMLNGCTGLTSAPALPATTLVDNCYKGMFQGCSNLNSVTCLATNISAEDCTNNWLDGVAVSGTFTKAEGVSWSEGDSGIPTGWNVVEAQ